MPKELGLTICPNPKCHRKIEEPILLNNLSAARTKQYYACPHCFTKLNEEAKSKEDTTRQSIPSPPSHPSLEKGLDVTSAQTKKQKEEKKEVPPVEPPEEEERGPSRCGGYLGYLARLPKNDPIPRECLTCPRVLDCVMEIGDY